MAELKFSKELPGNRVEMQELLDNGNRFIFFHSVLSIIILTFSFRSPVYMINHRESKFPYHKKHTLFTFFLGWWGLPFGLFFSLRAIFVNFSGGVDITKEVVGELNGKFPDWKLRVF